MLLYLNISFDIFEFDKYGTHVVASNPCTSVFRQ